MIRLTFDKIRDMVRDALRVLHGVDQNKKYLYILEIDAQSVVYNIEGGSPTVEETLKRGYSIDVDGKVSLASEAVPVEKVYVPTGFEVSFSAEEDGETVVYEGTVFEAGDYPDKGFAITAEELAKVAETFAPVPNDLEHKETILSGKLGTLEAVKAVGSTLVGKVRVPKWLSDLHGDKNPLKVSLAWDASRRITGNALTLRPRIEAAQVAAAFAEFAGRRNSTADQADLQSVHDLTVRLGATCQNGSAFSNQQERPKMNVKTLIQRLFNLDPEVEVPSDILEAETPQGEATPATPATPAAPTPEFTALQKSLEEKDKAVQALQNARISDAASAFAEGVIASGKAIPAQREALKTMFSAAVSDDAVERGGACFTDGGELMEDGSRVKSLKAMFDAAKTLPFTQEFARDENSNVDPEEKKKLLASTSLGRSLLNAQKKG